MFNLISASFFSCSKELRTINQDTVLPPIKINNGYLFAIADGLGGYKGGKEASQRVINYLSNNFAKELENELAELFPNIKNDLKLLSDSEIDYSNAASTLTVCYVTDKLIHIAHIGDCRLYAKNGLKLIQLTKDHTQHQSYIDDGIFTSRQNNGYLFAIADGLGGYKGGKEASQRVINYLSNNFAKELENELAELFPNIKNDLKLLSDSEIDYYSNAASTLTVCYVTDKLIHIAHIGDCRLYAKNGLKLIQLTKDHTQHQSYIDDGIFTSRQLKNAKGKNILTTAISRNIDLQYNVTITPLENLLDENGSLSLFIMSDGAHSFWEKRPRFSLNTLSEPSRFISSLKRRIENGPPVDDYSVISAKFTF
ncbi:PP2C family protein-serine/threonine phosphatase [Yersinia enterocolitica]|uniref:PP2C family protein-serine/threonine phosphatase n=1 Tax=Yersinia enterocolitica TaxID=630 RepID=UPI00030CDC9F|nr:protein phosphatase 2C domain-containing protein [Yersinia enterocolitica]